MSQQGSAPPPYAPEYGKPPAYFDPGANSATGGYPPYPTAHTAAQAGWHTTAQPPPPYHPQTETAQRQQARNPGGATVIAVTSTPAYITTQPQQQTVLVLGNCPSCRVGFLRDEFSICGVLMAIIFFPIGILCCLCMMDKRCSHCGARF